jgi:hypothetical protein
VVEVGVEGLVEGDPAQSIDPLRTTQDFAFVGLGPKHRDIDPVTPRLVLIDG